jgi:hypothetical protein
MAEKLSSRPCWFGNLEIVLFNCEALSLGAGNSPFVPYHCLNQTKAMRIDYTAPWNVRYWAQDYAQEAMETCIGGGWWRH